MKKFQYPSQDEAEAILELSIAVNKIVSGSLRSKKLIKAAHKLFDQKQKVFNDVFGDKSPWYVQPTKSGKLAVFLEQRKSQKFRHRIVVFSVEKSYF